MTITNPFTQRVARHCRGRAVGLVIALFLCGSGLWAMDRHVGPRRSSSTDTYKAGEILVTFKSGVTALASENVAAKAGGRAGRMVRRRHGPLMRRVHLAPGQSVEDGVSAWRRHPDVAHAQPNYIYRLFEVPDDTYFDLLWGLQNTGQTIEGVAGTPGADMDAVPGWDMILPTAVPVVVAVSDTGVDITHPDLAANIWVNPGEIPGNGIDDDGNGYVDDVTGWDFYDNDNNPWDGDGHGTHVAGTIGAVGNNAEGVVGVARHVRLMPVKIFDDTGLFGDTLSAVEAIDYAVQMGAKIINASWGGGPSDTLLYNAIRDAGTAGVLFVAAAGNGGDDLVGDNNDVDPMYPASYNLSSIISVAATDNRDQLASFSNYGRTTVDVGAPGVSIGSTFPSSQYGYSDGTSMAAPHVAGLAALIWSSYPAWPINDVKNFILYGTIAKLSLRGKTVSGGLVNAYVSMLLAEGFPISPQNFTGVALSTHSIRWSWEDRSSNEDGFRVLSISGDPLSIDLASDTTSWVEYGLDAGTEYSRFAQSFNSNGTSNSGSAICRTMAAPPLSPVAIFPNPYRPSRAAGSPMTIDHVLPSSKVTIRSPQGEILADLTAGADGVARWDQARSAPSGIYFIVVLDEAGRQQVIKAVIQK